MAEEYLLYDVDGTAAKVMRYVKHRILVANSVALFKQGSAGYGRKHSRLCE